ncbi:tryptophan--tRNA ligase [Candidatus Peregrinibacteria bacterium CG10_big_fil_rev_8_21_14_0_10_55_24]|nr:MAG: tryptophan--tRNA ligase [Candidatus Peregrinibacteria bacterium CG10_big_fil_rev_8_21_14_0_10_55_24]
MRVLSGIQPSGQLHLGNYFGSIVPNLALVGQAEQNFFFIADLHALTSMQEPAVLKQAREDIVLDYLACGFDPTKAIIFEQSQVPEHTQLLWILSCIAPMGLLERAVSYKDKVQQGIRASVGLFTYPVLMAADILLYRATHVPVGRDQKQHVEIARDLAGKFNAAFGEVFVIPEPVIQKDTAVVPGTDGRKMSKSYGNVIPLFGNENTLKKAIMGIVTDSKDAHAPKDPDTCVVYQIHKLFLSGAEAKALAQEYRSGLAYGEAKKRLLATVLEHLAPLRERRLGLKSSVAKEVLEAGRKKAQEVAHTTMAHVRESTGLS